VTPARLNPVFIGGAITAPRRRRRGLRAFLARLLLALSRSLH
jgi:hypothetical protein